MKHGFVLVILILAISVLLLTGCTDDQTDNTTQQSSNISTNNTISTVESGEQSQLVPSSGQGDPNPENPAQTTEQSVISTEETDDPGEDYVYEIGENAGVGGG